MKYLVAGLCLIFSTSVFADAKDNGAYAICSAQAKIQYGSEAIIKLHKIKRSTIELVVIKTARLL